MSSYRPHCEWCNRRTDRLRYTGDRGKYCSKRCGYEAEGITEWNETIGCFITTAVTQAEGKPDNCAELTILRNFRDTYMQETPERVSKVSTYYRIAPKIVKQIDAREDSTQVYTHLRTDYIDLALESIDAGDLERADEVYSDMVGWACQQTGVELK